MSCLFRKYNDAFSMKDKQIIFAQIMDNEFYTLFNYKMFVVVDKSIVMLSNADVTNLMFSDIAKRREIKEGMPAKAFIDMNGTDVGYRVFDSKKRLDHYAGNIVTDTKKHGIYFTVDEKELLRFILTAADEDFGDSIAVISLIDRSGKTIKNAHIAKGGDTPGTYRTLRFYIKDVKYLDDYIYIKHLYDIAYDRWKSLLLSDSEYGYYIKALRYYKEKGMDELVRALKDCHNYECELHGISNSADE